MLCYNNKERLRESLDSVVRLGDYMSVEVIVADNLSTDGSNEVLHEYAAQGKIRLLEMSGSRGYCRQQMLMQAEGSYLLSHMDCDDVFATKSLADFADSYRKNYDGLMIMTKRPTEEASNITIAPKELIENIGGWRDIQWGEDWDLWERAYEIGKYRFVPYPSVPLHEFIMVRRERQNEIRHKLSHRYLKYRDMLRIGRRPFQEGEHKSTLQRVAVALAFTSVTLKRSRLEPIECQDFDDMRELSPVRDAMSSTVATHDSSLASTHAADQVRGPENATRKLRILMIAGAFYPKIDGSVIAAGTLMNELVTMGHEVTLLTRGYDQLDYQKEWKGVSVERVEQHGFSLMARLLLVIDQTRMGAQLLKRKEFDVIHAHGFSSLLTAEMLRLFRHAPVIVTFHGLQRLWNRDWNFGSFWKFSLLLPAEGLLARRASLVIAQSNRLKTVLIHLYKIRPEMISVLPNPVDTSSFHFQPPPPQSRVVLFVGTIGTIYGPDLLVRAAKDVVARVPDAKFIFLGSGPAENTIRELARTLGVERSVSLLGRIENRAELEAYYAASRMLVVPFRGRGGYFLSLATLESLAVGRPAIVGYEMEETGGVITTNNEPITLAKQIIELLLLNDADYAKLAGEAKTAVERFSSAEVASEMEAAYIRLIQASK